MILPSAHPNRWRAWAKKITACSAIISPVAHTFLRQLPLQGPDEQGQEVITISAKGVAEKSH